MKKIQLLTTQSEFDELHAAADNSRGKVSVNREALEHLLTDHSVLLARLKSEVVEPAEPLKRQRRRILT